MNEFDFSPLDSIAQSGLLFSKSWRFKTGGSSQSSGSTLDKSQKATLRAVSDWIIPNLTGHRTGTPLPAELQVADLPPEFLDAYQGYGSNFNYDYGNIKSAVDNVMKGEPTYKYDAEKLNADFENNYSRHVMESWGNYAVPAIKNSMAFAGNTSFGSNMGRIIADSGQKLMEQTIAPKLFDAQMVGQERDFQSRESAVNRVLPAAGLSSQLFNTMAQPLITPYNVEDSIRAKRAEDWLRVNAQEYSPWLKLAMGYMTNPTQETVVKQNAGVPWGDILSAGAGIGMAAAVS